MADNKDKQEQSKTQEKIERENEPSSRVERQQEITPERKEISNEDRIVSAELRREIEMMQLDPSKKKDAEIEREKIEYLGQEEKLKHLLQIAREKGLVFAVHVANKMGDASIVDTLHDILAREGFYKDFTK